MKPTEKDLVINKIREMPGGTGIQGADFYCRSGGRDSVAGEEKRRRRECGRILTEPGVYR